jgi:DNA repair protein RecO (recombination protein O)
VIIDKTEALVLRVVPFSQTSHMVTWHTPAHGKITTAIKGATRPRSPFLGQYDLFYTCELLFYVRDRNGVHIARECAPLETRDALRRDWRAGICASYVCDLVWRVAPHGHLDPGLYRLAVQSLDFLCAATPHLPFLFWFELRLLQEAGMGPRFDSCPVCRRPHDTDLDRHAAFSFARGGILCAECERGENPRAVRVLPDVLAMLRLWHRAETPDAARNTRCTRKQCLDFERLLGAFLQYHLDVSVPGRRVAFQMLTLDPARVGRRRTNP